MATVKKATSKSSKPKKPSAKVEKPEVQGVARVVLDINNPEHGNKTYDQLVK